MSATRDTQVWTVVNPLSPPARLSARSDAACREARRAVFDYIRAPDEVVAKLLAEDEADALIPRPD